MVSALDSRSSFPGSSPGCDHCVVLLDKTAFTIKLHVSTQVYKWVPVN